MKPWDSSRTKTPYGAEQPVRPSSLQVHQGLWGVLTATHPHLACATSPIIPITPCLFLEDLVVNFRIEVARYCSLFTLARHTPQVSTLVGH